jgi:hypothetical protein
MHSFLGIANLTKFWLLINEQTKRIAAGNTRYKILPVQ